MIVSILCRFVQNLQRNPKLLSYPPYTFQVYIYATSLSKSASYELLLSYQKFLNQLSNIELIGPIPAIMAKKNKKFQHILIITAKKRAIIYYCITQLRAKLPANNKVIVQFDIDPVEIK